MQENCRLVWQNALSNKKAHKNTKSYDFIHDSVLIKNIIKRSSELRDQVIVFKLSSLAIINDKLLEDFATIIQLLDGCGVKIFIVHDHINLVSETLKLVGCDDSFIDGIKVVSHKNSKVMEMVLSGYINKRIVSKLCNLGCFAVGISCKDANLIQAQKPKTSNRRVTYQDVIDLDFAREPIMVNPEILMNFEDNNIIPVISPVACDENGNTHLLNVGLTASVIASTLEADHLILLCDKLDFTNENSLKVREISILQDVLNNSSNAGIIDLVEAAISSIKNTSNCVHFINTAFLNSILFSIFIDKES